MSFLKMYIILVYGFTFFSCALGAFSKEFCANLIQRFSLLLFALWTAWRTQMILEEGYGWPHEPLLATAVALYAIGTIHKTLTYRRNKP